MQTRRWAPWRTVWLAGLLLAAACSSSPPSQPPPLFDHLKVAPTFHSYHLTSGPGLVTSIVQDDAGQILVADHAHVYVLVRAGSGYSFTVLSPPSGVPTWQPTGLDYRNSLLYVANDNGHDVLVLRTAGNGLSVVRRITSPSLQRPQNVAADQDGSVVVADSAANALLKFNAAGNQLWRTALDRAWGVTLSGGGIFATSLASQVIVKVSPTGAIVKRAGTHGVALGKFQQPVGIATASGGRLVVTDEYNGRIALVDQNLRVVQQVGGNGAGTDAFNLPFATLPTDDGYVVADTYKYRLLRMDKNWQVRDQIVFGDSVPTGRGRPLVFGSDAKPSAYKMLPGVDVAADLGLRTPISFVGGFDGLEQAGDNPKNAAHLTFDDPQLGTMGQTWAQRVGPYVVVGSPTNSKLEVIDPGNGMFSYVEVGSDAWWRADGALIVHGSLRRTLVDVISPAVAAFSRTGQLLAQGVSRRDALNQALGGRQPRNLAADFQSAPGKQFLASRMTKDDARRYYDAVKNSRVQRVIELLEVKYLSGS